MVRQYRQLFPRETRLCVYNIVDDAAARAKLGEPVEEPWLDAIATFRWLSARARSIRGKAFPT